MVLIQLNRKKNILSKSSKSSGKPFVAYKVLSASTPNNLQTFETGHMNRVADLTNYNNKIKSYNARFYSLSLKALI